MPFHHHRPAAAARGAAVVLFASVAWLAAAPPAAGQRSDPGPRAEAPPEYTYQPSTIQMPRLLNADEITPQIAARFPPAMRDRKVTSGRVSLRFRILADSTVDSASIAVERASDPAFVEPATAIASRMRLAPAKLGGRTVPGWTRYDVDFRDPEEAVEDPKMVAIEEMPMLRNRQEVARHVSALYPPDLRERGVPGAVILRFRVSEDGTVDPTTITVPVVTDLEFDQPAMAVARRMRFEPAMVDGRPVAVWATLPLRFQTM